MDDRGMLALLCATGLLLAVLSFRNMRAARARRLARAGYFDRCQDLLKDNLTGRDGTGFARLSGRFGGQVFHLRAVPDTLTFRKLPALWVTVTLPAPLPVAADLDVLVRPIGTEPFTSFHRLPHQIDPPEGFPADCAIRTRGETTPLPAAILGKHQDLFRDPRIKELLITPNGLRIVFLAEEADRTRYLIFRDAEMGRAPVAPARIEPLLERLLRLKSDIETVRHTDREAA